MPHDGVRAGIYDLLAWLNADARLSELVHALGPNQTGHPDGQQNIYYEDGKLKEEQYYQMGNREKLWKKFDEAGSPVLMISYKNDIEVSINGVRIKLPESDTKLIK